MKRYKTPAGNEYSEEELRSKYGEQFDSLVADGTLELVGEAVDTEKKNPVVTPSDGEEAVTVSTTETETPLGSSDGLEVNVEQVEEVVETVPVEDYRNQVKLYDEETSRLIEANPDANEQQLEAIFNRGDAPSQDIYDAIESDDNAIFDLEEKNNKISTFQNSGYIGLNPDEGLSKGLTLSVDDSNLSDFDKERLRNREKQYGFLNPETGKTEFKKESDIDPDLLNSIELFEKTKFKSLNNYDDVRLLNTPSGLTREQLDLFKDILQNNEVDSDDYFKWEIKNTRGENSIYKFFNNLFGDDEEDQFLLEKRQYEKLQSYKALKLSESSKKLEANISAQKLTTDEEALKTLKAEEKELSAEFVNSVKSVNSTMDSFPKLKELQEDTDLKKRKRLYNSVQEGEWSEGGQGLLELAKTGVTALTGFAMDFVAGIPGFVDQRIAAMGGDEKGLLAGLSSMFSEMGKGFEREYGEASVASFQQGKPVYYKGKEYVVGTNGTVFDKNSNVRMDGIIPSDEIRKIQEIAKDVSKEVINWTSGSVLKGGVNTITNLFALIRTGKKVNKNLNLEKYVKAATAGKLGMAGASFVSGVVNNVDDIRSQLMATGMSETESMEIAVNAGQAISTLDAVFSGLAGSNEKLLVGFQGIKDQVKNLALKKGKSFTKKQLIDKGIALGKENFKELFVEELPVLFAEKGINYLVNETIGKNVLDTKITKANILETAVMTIGATSTLGGKKLLSGNRRSDLVRTIASDIGDIQATLDVLIEEGSLSSLEASNAYTEIYNMQTAENKTKGTIVVSENMQPASDLLTQRQNLINQREGLEGPLKKNIDDRIADVDSQLQALYDKDKIQAQEIINGESEGTVEINVTREDAIESLKAKNEANERLGLPVVLESDSNILKEQDRLIKEKQAELTFTTQESEGTVEINVTREDAIESLKAKNEANERLGLPMILESDENILKEQEKLTKDYQEVLTFYNTELQINTNNIAILQQNLASAIAVKSSPEYIKEVRDDIEQAKQNINEANKIIKKYKDAIQNKKTGDLSNAESTESVSEVEGEVRIDTQQETEAEAEVEAEVMSVNKERVDSIVDGIVEKTKNRGVGKDTNPQKIADNAISYLKGSKLFQESTDIERENILRDVSSKLGVEIKPPTAKKLLGMKRIGKPTTIEVSNDYAAMKKDLRKEAKIARDAKNDQKTKRKALQSSINLLLKAGRITTNKANTLLRKVSNIEYNNTKTVSELLDYVEKTMNDANYQKKLDESNSLRKTIKKNSKTKEAGLSDSAKNFSEINPSKVDDIDAYLEKAREIKDGLMPTKQTKNGLKTATPFDTKKADEYTKKEKEAQKEKDYELQKKAFQDLTGLDANDLTLEEMRDLLISLDGNTLTEEGKEKAANEKKDAVEKALKQAISNAKINAKQVIADSDVEVTKEQKKLLGEFLKMDMSVLTTKEKMKALDAILNFETNQSTGGMESILKQAKGSKGMKSLFKDKIISTSRSWFGGRYWNTSIATLPNVFELMFASQQKGAKVMDKIGVTDAINGAAKAERDSENIVKDYAKAFKKKVMKVGKFFDLANDIERGILGEIQRFTPGQEVKDFDDSKKLIENTYETLLKSSDLENQNKGKLIKEAYERLVKDSNNISEVQSKADPANLEGVKYMTDVWASNYDALAETSLNVYNKNLGKDTNYIPRSIQNISVESETEGRDITKPLFNPDGSSSVYSKKTGVLEESTKPSKLKEGRILNLGFDSQNMANLKSALTDINTAGAIQQIKGAIASESFNEVFPNDKSRDIVKKRIIDYIDAKRTGQRVKEDEKKALKVLNKAATFGVVKALGGITQPLKQIVPIFNTAVNAGIINTSKASALIFNKDVQNAINNSGLPIANRGASSQGDIEGVDSRIKKSATSIPGKVVDAIDKGNKAIIDKLLVAPDVQTARASFIAYYLKAMDKKGVKSGDIDFTKPLDKEAAQYAQQQVDRQQNTSDSDLQGGLFTKKDLQTQIIRKTLFPFANFLLNQKTRMYSDLNTLVRNPTALPGDKTAAAKSLGGLVVETAMFNAIGLGVTQMLSNVARMYTGEEEDPNLTSFKNREKNKKKKEKEFDARLAGRIGNVVADVFVPIPVLNDLVLAQANSMLSIMQEGDDDPFKFFAKTDKELGDQLGVLGIGGKKLILLKDMIMTIQSGEVTSEYFGKKSSKKLTPEALDKLNGVAGAYALHVVGLLPFSEVGYLSERAFKNISKMKVIDKKRDLEDEAFDLLEEEGQKAPNDQQVKERVKRIRKEEKSGQSSNLLNTKSKLRGSGSTNLLKSKGPLD